MTNRMYYDVKVNTAVGRPRIQPSNSTIHRHSSSIQDAVVGTDVVVAQGVTGRLTEDEVRQRQILKYSEDKIKFQQKEKEKAEKKRAEKFERYSHINLGQRLQDCSNRNSIRFICDEQQYQNDISSPSGLYLEQERNKIQGKRDEEKTEERLRKYSQCTNGQQLVKESHSTSSATASLSSENSNLNLNTKKRKEEEFRKQMRANREQLQNLYNEKAKHN